MKNVSAIIDFLTDEQTLGGIATGVSEQIDYSQKRADRAEERLNDWAMNRAERVEDKYRDELAENQDQIKVIAASLANEEYAANSPEVLSATQYLIQNYGGIVGAQAQAKKLYQESDRFGIDALANLAVDAGDDASKFTFSSIAEGLTTRPSKINLADSGIKIRRSFTDKMFDNDYSEDIQASLDAVSANISQEEVLPIIAKSGYDPDLVIRADQELGAEIARFKKLNRETSKNDPTNRTRIELIKGKIDLLKREKIYKEIGGAKSLTVTQYNQLGNLLLAEIANTKGLQVTGDVLRGDIITIETSNKNQQIAKAFVTRARDDLNRIRESGNEYIVGEMAALNAAIAQNRDYKVVEDEDGVKSIELVEDNVPLLKGFSTAPDDTVIPDDLPKSNLPSNSGAYANPPSVASSNATIDAAVAAYKNLPDDPALPDKQNARRAITDAVIAAFPGLNPTMVNAKVDALLE